MIPSYNCYSKKTPNKKYCNLELMSSSHVTNKKKKGSLSNDVFMFSAN